MPFPMALAPSETQNDSSRISTLVYDSIFYEDNYYTKRISKKDK